MTKTKIDVIIEYFLYKNSQDKKGLSNKKLQKLLYYSQAWFLALKKKKLFPENFEAWVHGPAIPRVYIRFKDFGYEDISGEINQKDFKKLSSFEKDLLDAIWDLYGKYDADYLELLSHNELPWQEARKDFSPFQSSSNIISTRTMLEYYGKKLTEEGRSAKS